MASNHNLPKTQKERGAFSTPDWVVRLMLGFLRPIASPAPRVLEPACGDCTFLRRLRELHPTLFAKAEKIGVELHPTSPNGLNGVRVIEHDFLLWEEQEAKYDLILGNPPYGIPSPSKHYAYRVSPETRAEYKKRFRTWFGKYNVYGAFIEKSVRLLKQGGQLLFIVPATFLLLDDFKKLRFFLAEEGQTQVVYMGDSVFRPEASITTVILNFVRSRKEAGRLLLQEYDAETGELKEIRRLATWRGEIITFATEFTKRLSALCSARLGEIFAVKVSPRTPEIRGNPLITKEPTPEMLPILNGRNLKRGKILYEPLSGYWIYPRHKNKLRKFFETPHVVVGLGFRGDRELGAAYDALAYPWMGDVYHLLPQHSLWRTTHLNPADVVNYLNSPLVGRYIRDSFREIVYHLNITLLKLIPIPEKAIGNLEQFYAEHGHFHELANPPRAV